MVGAISIITANYINPWFKKRPMPTLLEQVEAEVTNYHNLDDLRNAFIAHGYLEKDIDDVIRKLAHAGPKTAEARAVRLFSCKEILDRIGYGFVTHQFINILFFLTGAGYFLIGALNGLRAVVNTLFSSFLQEYAKRHDIGKDFMSASGIAFGFSFVLMAIAIRLQNLWLFSFALLAGSIGVVTYGDLYSRLIKETLKREKMTPFLARISYYGMLITAVSLLVAGWVLERFPLEGARARIFGVSVPIIGYLLTFEVTAIAFILSGYFLHFLQYRTPAKTYPLGKFIGEYTRTLHGQLAWFTRHRPIFLLLLATVLTASVQILGNSYYGIFIYDAFKTRGAGGFLNVAIIYAIALLVSFIGPLLTKHIHKAIGLTPMLVFGTWLMAFLPVTAVFNPNLLAIGVAVSFSILGNVIVGMAHGLLAHKILSEHDRQTYFASVSLATVIPFLVFIPLGAWWAQTHSLQSVFLNMGLILLVVVTTIYLFLVWISNKPGRQSQAVPASTQ